MSAQCIPEYQQPLIPQVRVISIGDVFSRLTVTSEMRRMQGGALWCDVLCSCGSATVARKSNLMAGTSTACGPCTYRAKLDRKNEQRKQQAVMEREASEREAERKAQGEAEEVKVAVRVGKFSRADKIRDALKEQPRTFDELITETRFNEDDLCDVLLRLLNKQEIEVWNVEINNLDFTRWYRLVQ